MKSPTMNDDRPPCIYKAKNLFLQISPKNRASKIQSCLPATSRGVFWRRSVGATDDTKRNVGLDRAEGASSRHTEGSVEIFLVKIDFLLDFKGSLSWNKL
jgi:hypothetical protein